MIALRPKWPMSAYSASAPVTASTTPANEKNAIPKFPTMNFTAYSGESAASICGWSAMPFTPLAPIATNQPIITGPKRRPTAPVPRRCTANSATMMLTVIGTIQPRSPGSITFMPSTADNTEIAGVIMLSPLNNAAPNTPSVASTTAVRPLRAPHRRTSAMSAMMPPSPSLSARITSVT
ncbi:MAG: hypothetical protein JWR34_5884 [Mycobacterium sp.]|nr:hypothetical protein [Mycobacterium sp.]